MAVMAVSASVFVRNVGAEEEVIPLGKLPQSILETVLKAFPEADAILGASKEPDEEVADEMVYEVTVQVRGRKIDVTVDEEGEIELLEKEITLNELPKAVTESLAKLYPESTLESAEGVYELEDGEQELEFYEVQLKAADGKEVEAKIKANGNIAKDDDGDDEGEEQNEDKE
ncbi:MAG: PepSY-like domain-containing protein [Planctomycetales bacterium]|nr:PepSY-like domain-containing protein [Planctomycetales bacterium]MCA9166348.1 PepSY-like domain-containing protein [Planctomycetales bacterium]